MALPKKKPAARGSTGPPWISLICLAAMNGSQIKPSSESLQTANLARRFSLSPSRAALVAVARPKREAAR